MRYLPVRLSHSVRSVSSVLIAAAFILSSGYDALKINPKPCSNAIGEEGTCMFVWECIKTEGKHLGTCVDGFLFGSCCGHNDTSNDIDFSSPRPPPVSMNPFTSSSHHQNYASSSSPSSSTSWGSSSSISSLPSSSFSFTSSSPSSPYSQSTTSSSPPTTTALTTTFNTEPTYTSTFMITASPQPTTQPTPTTSQPTTSSTTTKSPVQSTPHKPWPSAASPVHHAPVSSQTWPSQPVTTSAMPPATVLHTFRPPIFSIFGTQRPPTLSTLFMKPPRPTRPALHTFRPPMPVRPTASIFAPFHTRPPPPAPPPPTTPSTTTSTTTTTTTTTTTSTTTTTPAPYRPPPPPPKPQFPPYPPYGSSAVSAPEHHVTRRPLKPLTNVQCGVPPLHPQSKVVGGKNAAFGSWPWQASVRRTSFFGFSSTHRCGGAIIDKQWIATAGHCVDDLLLSQIRIRVGEYDFASVMEPYPFLERGAKRKVVHPQYNFFTYENDLALVQLDEPLDFQPHISPICLPPDNIELVGRNATVTGWGRLSEGGILPSVLQEVKVPIVSNDRCKSMFLAASRHEYIPEIFMCAGYEEGGRDSCQGDSGGPLQVQGDDGHWFLAGIISWGIGCAEPNLPGVCTRISKFKDWILKTVKTP
ncbi:Plasma kallikrein [Halotydeus destructor]|nr:Plasma kallikrein [Halotydeus destructor]